MTEKLPCDPSSELSEVAIHLHAFSSKRDDPGERLAAQRVEHGDHVIIDGRMFRVALLDDTAPRPAALGRLSLRFGVSRDEEHVELEIFCRNRRWRLEARAHMYPLYVLTRTRLQDAADASLPASAHGWIYQDELVDMLGYSHNRLNTEIYRARRQFASLGVRDAMKLVERRAATKQLRIGVGCLDIAVI